MLAGAQPRNDDSAQHRVYTGVGLTLNGGLFAVPLSVYLLASQPPGGIIPGVVVGGVSVVSIVAGIVEIAAGLSQQHQQRRLTFTGDGVRVAW